MNTWILKTSVLLIAMLAGGAALAQPTPAQTDAIKASCRSDYMKSCMSVPPGGHAAFDCLKRNMAALSPACQTAVNVIKPPAPAAAAPAPAPAPVAAPAAVAPAPAPAAMTPALTPAAVVATAPAVRAAPAPKRPTPAAVAPAAAVAATPAVAVAPAMPTPEQQAAIKNTCRADFMRNCRGVQPGGPEALICLKTNTAKLSPNCRTSVAAIADSIPAASAATANAAATTTAAAPAKRTYATPGIIPAVRIGRRIRERLENN